MRSPVVLECAYQIRGDRQRDLGHRNIKVCCYLVNGGIVNGTCKWTLRNSRQPAFLSTSFAMDFHLIQLPNEAVAIMIRFCFTVKTE